MWVSVNNYYLYHYFSVDFKCTVCNKTFTNKRNLKRHEQSKHSDAVFQCPECPKLFKRRDMLQRHSKTHALRERLPCPSCPRSFLLKRNLDIHRKRDHPVSLSIPAACAMKGSPNTGTTLSTETWFTSETNRPVNSRVPSLNNLREHTHVTTAIFRAMIVPALSGI